MVTGTGLLVMKNDDFNPRTVFFYLAGIFALALVFSILGQLIIETYNKKYRNKNVMGLGNR